MLNNGAKIDKPIIDNKTIIDKVLNRYVTTIIWRFRIKFGIMFAIDTFSFSVNF